MDIVVALVFLLLAFLLYSQFSDESKRRSREKEFRKLANLAPEVQELIKEEQKLKAISEYRRIYGAGLKEAESVITCHLP